MSGKEREDIRRNGIEFNQLRQYEEKSWQEHNQ